MLYYCDVCSLNFVCKDTLKDHLSGKKHNKRLEYVELIERSVVVSPLPKSISQFALFDFFQQYGTIRWHQLGRKVLIMEFNDRKSADALLKEPVWLNNVKLNIRRGRTKERKSERARQNGPTEAACPISYNKIKHIFEEQTTFDNQLAGFLNAVQLTDAEIQERYDCIVTQLDKIFKPLFPKCKSYKFGSTQTGLCFKECDLDIYMDIGEPIVETRSPSAWTTLLILEKANSLMQRMHHVFSHIIFIPKAKMPIIKFCYTQTNVFCDISFTNSLGIHKSDLLKYYISLDDRVRSLMMLVKYWARHFKISGTGKMPSYALMLLIIFYLQQPTVNITPPLMELQRACQPLIINGWQGNFNQNVALPPITNTNSISQLLRGFFSFYAAFEFKSLVICPLDGMAHNKSEFKSIDRLPRCMNRYKICVHTNKNLKLNLNGLMCVQDPIELCCNVTAAIIERTRLNYFVQYCAIGAEICATSSQNDYRDLLRTLFTTVVETKTTRDTIVVSISGKDFVRVNKSNDTETCTDVVDKGKFTKSDWYLTVFNIVRDILEKVFKVQVEIVSDNVAKKQQKPEMLSDVHTEKHQVIVLSCTGSHRVWYKRNYNMVFDPRLSCLEKEALMSDKIVENYDKESSPQKVNLEFMCEFQKAIHSPKVTLVISNKNSDDGVFRDFRLFARSKINKITQQTLTHMQQFNKRY